MKNIIKNIFAKKKIVVVSLIVILILFFIFSSILSKAEKVETYVTDIGNVEKYVEEIGELSAKDEYTINSRVNGIVEEVLKFEGDRVKKDELLIKINSEQLQLEVNALKAEIESVYSELGNLANTDGETISKLKSQIALDQNNYYESKNLYDNNTALFENGAISQSEMNTIKRAYEDSTERLKISKNNLSIAIKGVSKDLRDVYEKRIESMNYNLRILENQLDYSLIKAPMDGIITDKFVKVGDMVLGGTKVIEVSKPGEYIIKSDLLVGDSIKIKAGSKVIIKDSETDNSWIGEVIKVYPKAFTKISDLGIEQNRVKLEIVSEDLEFLKYRYEFDLKIIYDNRESVIRIKENALFKIDEKDCVFLVDNNKLVIRNVEIGLNGEDYVEILEGLNEGDLVVVSPGNSLFEGMKVKY